MIHHSQKVRNSKQATYRGFELHRPWSTASCGFQAKCKRRRAIAVARGSHHPIAGAESFLRRLRSSTIQLRERRSPNGGYPRWRPPISFCACRGAAFALAHAQRKAGGSSMAPREVATVTRPRRALDDPDGPEFPPGTPRAPDRVPCRLSRPRRWRITRSSVAARHGGLHGDTGGRDRLLGSFIRRWERQLGPRAVVTRSLHRSAHAAQSGGSWPWDLTGRGVGSESRRRLDLGVHGEVPGPRKRRFRRDPNDFAKAVQRTTRSCRGHSVGRR